MPRPSRHYEDLWQYMKEDWLEHKRNGAEPALIYSDLKDNYVYLVRASGPGVLMPRCSMYTLPFKEKHKRTGESEIQIGDVTINVHSLVTGYGSIPVPSIKWLMGGGGSCPMVWVSEHAKPATERKVILPYESIAPRGVSRYRTPAQGPMFLVYWASDASPTYFHEEAPAPIIGPSPDGPYKEVWDSISKEWLQHQMWDKAPPALFCSESNPDYVYLVYDDAKGRQPPLTEEEIPFRKDLERLPNHRLKLGQVTVDVSFLMTDHQHILFETWDWFVGNNGNPKVWILGYQNKPEYRWPSYLPHGEGFRQRYTDTVFVRWRDTCVTFQMRQPRLRQSLVPR